MAALPTICLSAIRALIPGGSWDATGAPSSASSSAQPSGAPSPYNSLPITSCRNVDKNLFYKEADEKSREVDHAERDYEFAGLQRFGRASLVAIAAASLCYSSPDPALAFRGGGPYGQEVTRGQDLTGRDYSGLTLIKQDFKTSILRQANFKGAKLLGASFFDSDLTGADLTGADLRGADLSLARLSKTNLTNANLEGASVTGNTYLKGSIITGADFTEVNWRDDQRRELCQIADGVNPVTGNATRETLLCD